MRIQSVKEQVNINPVSNFQLAEKNRELKASNDKVVALDNELQKAKEENNLLKTQI